MTERTDIILLVLAFLSVYTGWARGFCDEIMRLATYLLSGFAAYALIPIIQPFVPNLNNPPAEQAIALIAGAFIVCFVLRVGVKSLTGKVKSSEFNDLDKTGGALYGLIRGGVFVLMIAVAVAVVAPHALKGSKVLDTAYGKARPLVLNTTGIEMKEYADETDPVYWKTNVLNFIQDSKIVTDAGESSLLAYLCAYAVQEQEKQTGQKLSQEQCRSGFQAYLSSASEEEFAEKMQQEIRNEVLERMVESDEQNIGS